MVNGSKTNNLNYCLFFIVVRMNKKNLDPNNKWKKGKRKTTWSAKNPQKLKNNQMWSEQQIG